MLIVKSERGFPKGKNMSLNSGQFKNVLCFLFYQVELVVRNYSKQQLPEPPVPEDKICNSSSHVKVHTKILLSACYEPKKK